MLRSSLGWLEALPDDVRGVVEGAFREVSIPFGGSVFEQGEDADAYYVVRRGFARVFFQEHDAEISLARLGAGEGFGEEGLLSASQRTASVRASTDLVLARLDGDLFLSVLARYPEIRAVFGQQARERVLSGLLRRHASFNELPQPVLNRLVGSLKARVVHDGEAVFTQGAAPDGVYLLSRGRLSVSIAPTDGSEPRQVRVLRAGDVFGELGLLSGRPRTATVTGAGSGSGDLSGDGGATVLRLPLAEFHELCDAHPSVAAKLADAEMLYVMSLDSSAEPLPVMEPLEPLGFDAVELVDAPRESVRRRRFRKRFPDLRQIDEADCGAACLAMICRSFGHDISLSAIRMAARTDLSGTSLNGLVEGGESLGLEMRAIKSSPDRIGTLALPAILHWSGNHWVVLHEVVGETVRINDPELGRRTVGRKELGRKWSGFAALAAPTPRLADAPRSGLQLGWLLPFIRPHRGRLVIATLLALLAAAMQMLLPVFSQRVIDTVVVGGDHSELALLVGGIFATLVLLTDITLLQRVIMARLAVKLDFDTVSYLSTSLLRLPLRYFQTRRTGDIQRRITGMRQIRQVLVETGVGAITSLTQAVIAIVVMAYYSAGMALLFLATAPVYAFLTRYSRSRLRPIFDAVEEGVATYQSQQIDAIKGIEAVKAMGAENRLADRLQKQFASLQGIMFRADMTVMVYEAMVVGLSLSIYGLFLGVGAEQVIHHHLSIGGLIAFNSLVLFANGPVVALLDSYDRVQLVSVLLTRLQDVFDAEPEQGRDHSALLSAPALEGSVRMAGVSFYYDTPDHPILTDIDLDVPAGATVAFVGRSGSGKSTLAKCLAGLVVPTSGSIEYDGIDISTLRVSELRQRIGVVLQTPYLFDDTIAANVAFGAPEPDPVMVARAADIANATEFCRDLPLGFDTRVGDSGLTLSGGQAQRLSIARAVYGQPAVIILDEATSALDAEAERAVKRNLDTLLHGRTAFVVAHRLSTIRNADLICVLERGRIVERGDHDHLMQRQGLYAYLVGQQLG